MHLQRIKKVVARLESQLTFQKQRIGDARLKEHSLPKC